MPKQVDTTIVAARRLSNTAVGNPRWKLITSEGVFPTGRDSQAGIDAANFVPGEGQTVPVRLTVSAGVVIKIEGRKEEEC